MRLAVQSHGPALHLIVASAGNAGLAVATAAKALNLKCTVFLPDGTSPRVLQFLRTAGADVHVEGNCYADALLGAKVAAETDPNG